MNSLLNRRRVVLNVFATALVTALFLWYFSFVRSDEVERKNAGKPILRSALGNFEPKPMVEVTTGSEQDWRAQLLREAQQSRAKKSLAEYGMNMASSDEVALDRSIPDLRLPECKYWDYPEDLPTTSVVIVFHNEGWSTLLRTIHSVLNRTPPQFLEEVLLMDDFSDKEHLKDDLENYVWQLGGKVRLVHNRERQGLIQTRCRGAAAARGEVVLFLDAHCEVNVNWLPPLLAPIRANRTVLTVPMVDSIDHDTFEYAPVYQPSDLHRGIFEWGMLYKETQLPRREVHARDYGSDPYKSPTHPGGLFAINREYFLELGGYDPGLRVWGGENFDLSFKIWQCGGSILWVPCSRVGHVYRSHSPYDASMLAPNESIAFISLTNYKRVVETWFDEKHKEFFYVREPMARFLDMGSISAQLAQKKRLNCKSFQWFMENVGYDVVHSFPELPPNLLWGTVRNNATSRGIISVGSELPSFLETSDSPRFWEVMRLNVAGQLGVGERCVDADSEGVKLVYCSIGSVDGSWEYDQSAQTLRHNIARKCVAALPASSYLSLMACDPDDEYQQWTFDQVHAKSRLAY